MRPDPFPTASPVCGPDGLQDGERLLLWMLRQWVAARILREDPRARLAAFAGPYVSPRGAAAFVLLMTAIEARVRRPLCVAPPRCQGYALDEQRIVTACGIGPRAPEIAAQLLGPLVAGSQVVANLARILNTTFAREGLSLPVRLEDRQSAPIPRPTLH